MTAEEMKYEGEILYESISSGNAPGYTNREWSYLLTAGQEKVIKEIIDKGLDKEEKYKKSISPVMVPISVTGAFLVDNTSAIPNSIRVVIDNNYIGTTMERAWLTSQFVKVKPITHDYYDININNPFKKPDSNRVFWRLDQIYGSDKVHIIITDLTTIESLTKYEYVAINKPTPIIVKDSTYVAGHGSIDGVYFNYGTDNYTTKNLDSILGTFVHRWIVQEAVKLAFGSDKDQIGYQISNAENIQNLKN